MHADGACPLGSAAAPRPASPSAARARPGAPGFHDDQLPALRPLLAQLIEEEGIIDPVAWFYTPMARAAA